MSESMFSRMAADQHNRKTSITISNNSAVHKIEKPAEEIKLEISSPRKTPFPPADEDDRKN